MNRGKLESRHIVEVTLWLLLCAFLFAYSFEFDKDIEIYKFGASAWPRAIILLIALAAIGQFVQHWKRGDEITSEMLSAAVDDGAEDAAQDSDHESARWYLSTLGLLVIPFAYLRVPDWIGVLIGLEGTETHLIRIVVAVVLIAIFLFFMRRNMVGAILTLPLFFAAMLEDLGFYSLAPFFIIGVMFLFGERRPKPMVAIMALILSLLLLLFVKILYVGLPTGNIHPFYDIGTWIVTVLQ
ncbi:MAG: hypothetical protein AAF420_06130 [Pseudomonadota bacterium]